jgi:hypothetical protein
MAQIFIGVVVLAVVAIALAALRRVRRTDGIPPSDVLRSVASTGQSRAKDVATTAADESVTGKTWNAPNASAGVVVSETPVRSSLELKGSDEASLADAVQPGIAEWIPIKPHLQMPVKVIEDLADSCENNAVPQGGEKTEHRDIFKATIVKEGIGLRDPSTKGPSDTTGLVTTGDDIAVGIARIRGSETQVNSAACSDIEVADGGGQRNTVTGAQNSANVELIADATSAQELATARQKESKSSRQYRPPIRRRPTSGDPTVRGDVEAAREGRERALSLEVRLIFEKGGFCRVSLLPQRTADLPESMFVSSVGGEVMLVAMQDDW